MGITSYNDWDAALDEAYLRAVMEGRIKPPEPQVTLSLDDYGRSVEFKREDLDPGGA